MTTIKIVGVPEHFNLPWHLAIENDEFNQQNIDLQWTDVPEGLAKMPNVTFWRPTCNLTEGIVKTLWLEIQLKLYKFTSKALNMGFTLQNHLKTISDLE
jgi:hypothetical protein